jgi:hypothetical protein
MPSFVSKNGIWEPAQEKAYDPKSGEIYVGPDRAATIVEKENGGPLGQDGLIDPQNLQAARNMGFATVDEMFKAMTPTPKQVEDIAKAQVKVVDHKDQEPKQGVSGPTDGGFYDPEHETPEEVMVSKRRGRPRKV